MDDDEMVRQPEAPWQAFQAAQDPEETAEGLQVVEGMVTGDATRPQRRRHGSQKQEARQAPWLEARASSQFPPQHPHRSASGAGESAPSWSPLPS